jgi:hypothetical protein
MNRSRGIVAAKALYRLITSGTVTTTATTISPTRSPTYTTSTSTGGANVNDAGEGHGTGSGGISANVGGTPPPAPYCNDDYRYCCYASLLELSLHLVSLL